MERFLSVSLMSAEPTVAESCQELNRDEWMMAEVQMSKQRWQADRAHRVLMKWGRKEKAMKSKQGSEANISHGDLSTRR